MKLSIQALIYILLLTVAVLQTYAVPLNLLLKAPPAYPLNYTRSPEKVQFPQGTNVVASAVLNQDFFNSLAGASRDIITRILLVKSFPEPPAIQPSFLGKRVRFEAGQIQIQSAAMASFEILLRDGYVTLEARGIACQGFSELKVNGQPKGQAKVGIVGDLSVDISVVNDGKGGLHSKVIRSTPNLRLSKIQIPWNNWLLNTINFIFRGIVRSKFNSFATGFIGDWLPVVLDYVYDELRVLQGDASLLLFSLGNYLIGDPLIEPGIARLTIGTTAKFITPHLSQF